MKLKIYEKMYKMYKKGYSLKQVGKMFGRSHQYVWVGFKNMGYELRKKKVLPFVLVDDIKFTRRNVYYNSTFNPRIYLHRYIWEKHNGAIPHGYDIHHIDGNIINNDISNLVMLSHGEHKALHGRKHCDDHQCDICGKLFNINGARQKNKKTCSPKCARELTLKNYRTTISKRNK